LRTSGRRWQANPAAACLMGTRRPCFCWMDESEKPFFLFAQDVHELGPAAAAVQVFLEPGFSSSRRVARSRFIGGGVLRDPSGGLIISPRSACPSSRGGQHLPTSQRRKKSLSAIVSLLLAQDLPPALLGCGIPTRAAPLPEPLDTNRPFCNRSFRVFPRLMRVGLAQRPANGGHYACMSVQITIP